MRGVLNQLHQFLRRQHKQQPTCDGEPAVDDVTVSATQSVERRHDDDCTSAPVGLVTMSAGNYGKAFAFVTAAVAAGDAELGQSAAGPAGGRPRLGRRLVVMPSSAPDCRQTVIEVRIYI